MNTDLLIQLQTKMGELEQRIADTEMLVNRLKVDRQKMLERRKTTMKPGIGCKISYDNNGLVTGSLGLDSTDIPMIPTSKVQGLDESLETKANVSDINRLKASIVESGKKSTIANTGCKVNVDANGHVVSVADLIPDDIPVLPLEKIEGIGEVLQQLREFSPSVSTISTERTVIKPGTGCKITYDKFGSVVRSDKLDMNDIPSELITQINRIEGSIAEMASKKTVQSITQKLGTKLEVLNSEVKAGVYTKVIVDSNGLVTSGDTLSKRDLPELGVRDINGLKQAIDSKADREQVSSLNETVNNLMGSLNIVKSVSNMKAELDTKVNREELGEVKRDIKELKEILNRILRSLPDEEV